MKHSKFRAFAVIILFAMYISFPLLNDTFGLVADTPNLENRALKKKPVFDINLLDPYPAEFDTFYNDHFSVRSLAIKYYNLFILKVFQKTPFPTYVVVGYNNWLFQGGDEMNAYEEHRYFTPENLKTIKQALESRNTFLEKHGCKFYFCITPNKAVIYPENIPHTHYKFLKESLGEQLNNYLEKSSKINSIQLYAPFLKIKKEHQLYYKLDSHWNRKGAFFASATICSVIGADFPEVKPLIISDYLVTETSRTHGNILQIIGNPDFYEDSDHQFALKESGEPIKFDSLYYPEPFVFRRESKKPEKPNILLMSDSYSNALFPFLAQSFNTSLSQFDLWIYKLDTNLVKKEKPQAYLLMVHESLLWNLLYNN